MLVCFERDAECTQCGASVTCAPLQKASDGMLISGMPIPGCHSPLPLGSTIAFQENGLGLLPTAARGREDHRQPTSVTTLGGPAAGARGQCAAGGPGNLPTARALAAPTGCDTGSPGRAVAAELQPAKRAAGGPKPTPGRRCGPGAACKPVASDWRWATARTVPARRILPVCYRSTDCTAKHDNCAGALASRSRGKLWPHLRSTIAPWGFLRVRL